MTFDLEYNSERPLMIIPEYGRHIQKLVDHCVALETKKRAIKWQKQLLMSWGIYNLIYEMSQILNTNYGISCTLCPILNWMLESPYPQPSKEELQEKPEALAYPKSASRYRYYGNNIQTMIDIALSWEAGEKKKHWFLPLPII